jgi:hypothetical protein
MKAIILLIIFSLTNIFVFGQVITINEFKDGVKGHVSLIETTNYNIYPNIDNKYLSVFNTKGQITNSVYYDSSKVIPSYNWIFQYNKSQKLMAFAQKKSDTVTLKYVNKFNLSGQLIEQVINFKSYRHFQPTKCIFRYNKNKQLVAVYINQRGIDIWPKAKKYIYNKKGQIVFIEHYSGYTDLESKTLMTYNKHGNVARTISIPVTHISIESYNDTTSYAYKYDKKGNWVIKYMTDNNKRFEIVNTRKITYYPNYSNIP